MAADCWPGNRIYWPTKDQDRDPRPGHRLRAEPPIKLMEIYQTTGGNLVAGDGYLIVAQPDALVVFCQNSRLIERYRDEIARNPDRAATHYRLARAAEAVGRTSSRWNRTTRRPAGTNRPRRSTACPWPRRLATTSSGCSCGVAATARGDKKFGEAISGAGDRLAGSPGPTATVSGPGCSWPRSRCKPMAATAIRRFSSRH